eukprot:scaffold99632_cov20-Tisochrysis_lutea.AAC.2
MLFECALEAGGGALLALMTATARMAAAPSQQKWVLLCRCELEAEGDALHAGGGEGAERKEVVRKMRRGNWKVVGQAIWCHSKTSLCILVHILVPLQDQPLYPCTYPALPCVLQELEDPDPQQGGDERTDCRPAQGCWSSEATPTRVLPHASGAV